MRSVVGERIATALTHLVISRRLNLFRHRSLAVLAIGMQPSVNAADIPAEIIADSSGFIENSTVNSGLFGAG